MLYPHRMVAVGCLSAWLPTPWWLGLLFPPTGGTRPRAALLVTRMPLTVPRLLTLQLTSKGLGTLHLLHLVPAPALLAGHVQAGGAVAPVASLRAVMAPTPQHLPT